MMKAQVQFPELPGSLPALRVRSSPWILLKCVPEINKNKRQLDKQSVATIHNGTLLRCKKKNKTMKYEATWIKLESIIMSEELEDRTEAAGLPNMQDINHHHGGITNAQRQQKLRAWHQKETYHWEKVGWWRETRAKEEGSGYLGGQCGDGIFPGWNPTNNPVPKIKYWKVK